MRTSAMIGHRLLQAMAIAVLVVSSATAAASSTQVLGYLADQHVAAFERSAGSTEARRSAARACRAATRNGKAVPLGVPGAARSRGTFEWLSGHPRSALRWWGRSLDASERIGMPYQIALTEFDFGRLSGDRVRLEHAAVVFADLGAELDGARANEALSLVSA